MSINWPVKPLVAAVLALGLHAGDGLAVTYDATAEFSLLANPAGVWGYGHETVLGGAFTAHTFSGVSGVVQGWGLNSTLTPGAFVNPADIDRDSASTIFRAHQLHLHPGPSGQYSVVRFTAPSAGEWDLVSSFEMRSYAGSKSTTVDVLKGGVGVYSGVVSGLGDKDVFAATLQLAAGETVDFIVGANGLYTGDTTELRAQLTLVPEPGTYALMLAGMAAVGIGARRRSTPV